MSGCNAYESRCMNDAMGETLRPGGFRLTELAARLCGLAPGDAVLDLGCGKGATVNYLYENFGIKAVGVDPSEKLTALAREKFGYAEFISGRGEELPFGDDSFDCILCECTLSLMDAEKALGQVFRVLKPGGRFAVSDVYAKNAEAARGLKEYSINSCIRNMFDLNGLKNSLRKTGLEVKYLADYSFFLKEMVVKIGFSYGSMCDFWSSASGGCVNGGDFYNKIKKCKPGYFMLIAEKGGYGK